MLFPDGTAVELGQRLRPGCHVPKPAHPDEMVGPVHVAELAHDPHAHGFLALDKLPVEQLDQRLPLAGMQQVLPQFEDVVRQRGSSLKQELLQRRSGSRTGRPNVISSPVGP